MEKFADIKRRMDRNGSYFWQNRDGRFALVNALTLKTACGTMHRIEAIRLTETLHNNGFRVAELQPEDF